MQSPNDSYGDNNDDDDDDDDDDDEERTCKSAIRL